MPQKSIKAVMDELTAMAQDKNTSPRAFADSFQAHSAELRAVFFPDTPMKMPETHDDTEESSQECVTCFCEFLAKCTSADDQNCPVTIVVSAHELPTVSVQTISGAKVIFDAYTLAEVWTKTRADVFGNWKRFGAKIPRTAASSRNSARS